MKNHLKLNQLVYFTYKNATKKGRIIKLNPKTIIVKCINDNYSFKMGYNSIHLNKEEPKKIKILRFKSSNINNNEDLKHLLNLVKNEYKDIFFKLIKDKTKLNNVKIAWKNRITYRNMGSYYHEENMIKISKSFKNLPKFIIGNVIYHELLHIELKKHNSKFRYYEKLYKNYNKCVRFNRIFLNEIRINGYNRYIIME